MERDGEVRCVCNLPRRCAIGSAMSLAPERKSGVAVAGMACRQYESAIREESVRSDRSDRAAHQTVKAVLPHPKPNVRSQSPLTP